MKLEAFEIDGFALVPEVLSADECAAISAHIQPRAMSGGTRCLLPHPWCAALANKLRERICLLGFLPEGHVAVQCTYFEKSSSRNWLVPIHQDLSIPVAGRVDDPRLRGWAEKEGLLFVQAPVELLEELVAVRVHLDACTLDDGPLQVVAGSHVHGRIDPEDALLARNATPEVRCIASRGSALLMRPLLLHASSKATGTSLRRVLHFVFGPRALPHGLQWQHMV